MLKMGVSEKNNGHRIQEADLCLSIPQWDDLQRACSLVHSQVISIRVLARIVKLGSSAWHA